MTTPKQDKKRKEIIAASEMILIRDGRDALTIRDIAIAANVQAPTIYRLFGDKKGLLDAIVERGFIRYMRIDPVHSDIPDLIEELRIGWDIHVDFGIANPELYKLMFDDSFSGNPSPGAEIAFQGFRSPIKRMFVENKLLVSEEEAMFKAFATASGVVIASFTLPLFDDIHKYRYTIREELIKSITVA